MEMESHVHILWWGLTMAFGAGVFIVGPFEEAKTTGQKYIGKTVLMVVLYLYGTGPVLVWLVFQVVLDYEGAKYQFETTTFEDLEWWSYALAGLHLVECCGIFRRGYVARNAAHAERVK